MDIHPPHGDITSVKQFLLHLLTITIGILIALSLEGLLEWHHHRGLVSEARENLRREVEDNKRELDNVLKGGEQEQQNVGTVLNVMATLLKHQKLNVSSLNLKYEIAELRSASWDTARATGAIAYMDYREVEGYGQVYDLQQRFDRVQDNLVQSFIAAISIANRDPTTLSEPELREAQASLRRVLGHLAAEGDIGKGLERKYDAVLADKH